jgi:Type IV secretion-system coupling protein DNA-binding domain
MSYALATRAPATLKIVRAPSLVRVSGLVLVRAGTYARARELADHVLGCVRSRRGAIGGVRTRTTRGFRSSDVQPQTRPSDGWLSTPELLGLLAWPLGSAPAAGVEVSSFREIAASTNIPRTGRRLFVGRDAGGERDIALSPTSARQHVAVLGPTGSGKSAVLARSVLDDMSAGYGGVLIDPKDLVDEVLDRIPAAHADRIVVLDPADPTSVPGLDLFGTGDPELRSDAIFSAVRNLSEGWGPRIDQFLRLGLRTVAELPNPTLSDWLRLYSDPALRRQAAAGLDPIRRSEWADYEELSPAAQREFIAPAASRITSLLSRPGLRAVLNQPEPKLDIARVLAERKWLFVRLAPGTLGEPAARVLAAIVTYLTWTAIEARVSLPAEQRHPVFLYLDELQSLTDLPMSLERFFERTRGLGCGVTVATQTLKRLPDDVRASLLGNVGNLIMFAAGKEEAARVAGELPGLSATDIQHLGSYQVAARVHTEHGGRVLTGRTEPLPPRTGQARAIRARSAERYGVDPSSVDAEIERRFESKTRANEAAGRTGRRP